MSSCFGQACRGHARRGDRWSSLALRPATASATEIARGYAPELRLKGAVVGAPPADLDQVADNLDGSASCTYSAYSDYAFSGFAAGYGIDTEPVPEPPREAGHRDLRDNQCTTQARAKYPFLQSRSRAVDGRPLTERLKQAPWDTVVAEQRLGRRTPATPVLLSHSRLDDVIPHRISGTLAADWCRRARP